MIAPTNNSLRYTLLRGIGDFILANLNPGNGCKNTIAPDALSIGTSFVPSNKTSNWINIFETIFNNPQERGGMRAGGDDDGALAYNVSFDINGAGAVGIATDPAFETYELMADVKRVIGMIDEQFIHPNLPFYGVYLVKTISDPGQILPKTNGEGKTLDPMFVVQLQIRISESVADPYRLTD